ncbi:hypothetical protein F5Y15DRAFT_396244 [Xylariaceae sp. FL0016]|nr:hypothetical protein F5Y15DRAFT_396244 [Xylariaceae sp. FL0016]
MAPRTRRAPSLTSVRSSGSASEAASAKDSDDDLLVKKIMDSPKDVPNAIAKIEKHRTTRDRVRKDINRDYEKRMADLKKKIETHYAEERHKITSRTKHYLSTLHEYQSKQAVLESAIEDRVHRLRTEWAQMADLINAVYEGQIRKIIKVEAEVCTQPAQETENEKDCENSGDVQDQNGGTVNEEKQSLEMAREPTPFGLGTRLGFEL